METVKVEVREFRENLAGYLESGTLLAIMHRRDPWVLYSGTEAKPESRT
jgi:hypothetical protein